ncbi:hypothetical protein [Stratiformator vulcanicus]|uniref:Uncharacterized protein n=1 Tax=Stratiformator vulcanicus TaxID=2527980 RepID=A0A517QYD7_9PLAN|nr:hypothetical protein [Stratiformator vulcanicus]QDT36608.1 hypothetical protein Pan189_09680 [Stratiformator vulcanicus]
MNHVFLNSEVVDDYVKAAGIKYKDLAKRLGFEDARHLRYLRSRKNYASWNTVVLLADILNETVPWHGRDRAITPLQLIDGLTDPGGVYKRLIVATRLGGLEPIRDAEHLQCPDAIWECVGEGEFPLFRKFEPVDGRSAPEWFFETFFSLFEYVPSPDEFQLLQREDDFVVVRTCPWLRHRQSGRTRSFACRSSFRLDAAERITEMTITFDESPELIRFYETGR